MQVAGKVVVVTGAGSGIGRALVLELLRRGAGAVAAVDLRAEGLEETVRVANAGERVSTWTCDVTDRDAVDALPMQLIDAHGVVDVVINNAGIIQPFVPFNQLDRDIIDRIIDVNLHGPINVLKAFLPHLLDRRAAHVVNVASMGAFLPVPGQTVYGATKAAVKLLSEGLYAELLDTHVGVTVVMPGGVDTSISENSGVAVPQAAAGSDYTTTSAEDAARTIVDGIEQDRLHVLVGRDAQTMNLLTRVAPKQATHLIKRQMSNLLGG